MKYDPWRCDMVVGLLHTNAVSVMVMAACVAAKKATLRDRSHWGRDGKNLSRTSMYWYAQV